MSETQSTPTTRDILKEFAPQFVALDEAEGLMRKAPLHRDFYPRKDDFLGLAYDQTRALLDAYAQALADLEAARAELAELQAQRDELISIQCSSHWRHLDESPKQEEA